MTDHAVTRNMKLTQLIEKLEAVKAEFGDEVEVRARAKQFITPYEIKTVVRDGSAAFIEIEVRA